MKRNVYVAFALVGFLVFGSCGGDVAESNTSAAADALADSLIVPAFIEVVEPQVEIDLDSISARGKLTALTGYSATSYFIYKGQPLGFEYELLQKLADKLGLDLEIKVIKDLDRIFSFLNEGEGDLIAYNMTVTKDRLKKVSFTDHHTLIRQVLIQRLPDGWRNMKRHQIDRALLNNPTELINQKVHVRKGSSYYHRLLHLSDEIGGDIDIVEVPGDVSTEELISRVARGEIQYTVADENVAQVNSGYHQNIDIRMAVSLPQRIAWAVRSNSPALQTAINEWLGSVRSQPTFNVLYNKYHQNKRFFRQRVDSEFFSLTSNNISPYDELIQSHAVDIGWDWRLLASQIYQESQFDPRAKSWIGARGLMQLMPATAREFGATKLYDPVDNIAAGTRYLQWLESYWQQIPDSTERLHFILASYNAGPGHVQDARNLTRKFGKDPNAWHGNVAEYIKLKSKRKYFLDEVVKYGYCRGEEPVNYVVDILDRYEHYQKFIDL